MFRVVHLWFIGCLLSLAILACCNIGSIIDGGKAIEGGRNGNPATGKRFAPDPRPWWGKDSMLTAKRWGPYQFWDTTAQLYPVMPLEDSATGFVGIGHNQYHGKWSVYFYSAEIDSNNRPTALEPYLWLYTAPISAKPESEGTYSTAVYTGYDVRIPNDRMKCLGDTIVITDRTTGHRDSVINGVSGRFPFQDTLRAAINAHPSETEWNGEADAVVMNDANDDILRTRILIALIILATKNTRRYATQPE